MDHPEPAFEPAATLQITELGTLKLISDPLRARLVDLLRVAALTAKELAERLALGPKQLYYHLNLLERHGLIRVVQTRLVSGIVEKRYRATALLFLFDDEVFSAQQSDQLPEGIGLLFDTTRNQLARSFTRGAVTTPSIKDHAVQPGDLLLKWSMRRLSPADMARLYAELAAVCQAFEVPIETDDPAAREFRLFVTLFPISAEQVDPPER
jgi:DNA-binding transcriptional ArsR family regulator